MSSSPSICQSHYVNKSNSCSPSGTNQHDYFTMIPTPYPAPINSPSHLPHTTRATSGHHHSKKPETPSGDFFLRRLGRMNSSPTITRHSNESFNSPNSADSSVNDSSYLRHKNSDSINSNTTQVDDSPSKTAFNLNMKLPKLSINENTESNFTFNAPPTGTRTVAPGSNVDSYFTPNVTTNTNDVSSSTQTSDFTQHDWPKVRSSSLVNLNLGQPPLSKQFTTPNIKTLHELKTPPTDHLPSILKLSDQIKLLDHNGLNDLLAKVKVVPDLELPNLIVIDIRSFTDFIKSHIKSSLNICLPSTLLKRSNFTFNRCINSLPNYEKLIMKTYFNFEESNKSNNLEYTDLNGIECSKFGFPSILVYDNCCNSANIYHMLKKITDEFKLRELNIYLVRDNFSQLSTLSGSPSRLELESGNSQHFNVDVLKSKDSDLCKDIIVLLESPDGSKPNVPKALNDFKQVPKLPRAKLNSPNPLESSTPILSNFKLPTMAPTPTFKIRHNEELVDNTTSLGVDLVKKFNEKEFDKLPKWLPYDSLREPALIEKFNKLEKTEKDRLNQALDVKNDLISISSGIEMGYKNRYKDILLYEHSRVKLFDFGNDDLSNCDYINASYIDSVKGLNVSESWGEGDHFKYIATQGPLKHTIGDFYKCILNNNARIIISLTNEQENGMNKCDPYWKPGTYVSNQNHLTITVEAVDKLAPNIVVRHLKVGENGDVRSILQIQLLDWMDNDICENIPELMAIIQLRNHLVDKMGLTGYNTLIHCSAGCGRTGTFITVDTIINMIEQKYDFTTDIIPKIVDNLRGQRISMVQNLRQFISVYATILYYFNKKFTTDMRSNSVNEFMKTKS